MMAAMMAATALMVGPSQIQGVKSSLVPCSVSAAGRRSIGETTLSETKWSEVGSTERADTGIGEREAVEEPNKATIRISWMRQNLALGL